MNPRHASSLSLATVPARDSLCDAIAQEVLRAYGDKPETLSRVLLLLPTRRAILSQRDAFLRITDGKALLLPQMQALGDGDERFILRYCRLSASDMQQLQSLPPAIGELERLLQLAQLIASYHRQRRGFLRFEQAVSLATQLADLLDELYREQVDFAGFDQLAPEEFAVQWQETLDFLQIIRHQWPLCLQQQGKIESWQRRNSLLQLWNRSWQQSPPDFPVIAAGSTGSIPAVAALLHTIAALPTGKVILPAFDASLRPEIQSHIEESHPQYGMQQWLERIGASREDVEILAESPLPSARETWLSLSLQPANTTEEWRSSSHLDTVQATACTAYYPCADIRQESLVIALLLREALETPAETAALVTTNRELARQVKSQLQRWDITIDDSAGTPLHHCPAGNFMVLLLECIESHNAPVALLALLKHPLARLGMPAVKIRQLTRKLEILTLRGIKPAGFHAMRQLTESSSDAIALHAFLQQLETALEPLATLSLEEGFSSRETLLATLTDRLRQVAESFAQDETGVNLLWQGEEAEALSQTLAELEEAAAGISLPFSEFRGLISQLLQMQRFRSKWQGHPRLQILSPMEARMLSCDRVILGGLNEDEWPAKSEGDPWLNRAMRKSLTLPTPERQIGLLAHDFVSLAAQPEVFFTRSRKSEGTETVPSRFLQRMEVVLQLAGGKAALDAWRGDKFPQMAQLLDVPTIAEPHHRILPPRPTPPVAVRPRELPVTAIERLIRDPYGIYAQRILRLKVLDPLQQIPQGREFGNAVHQALENFVIQGGLQVDAPLPFLLDHGNAVFATLGDAFMVEALWKPRFAQIAKWLLQQDWSDTVFCEMKGKWEFDLPAGIFTLTARVDRIDITPEGLRLIDYKTGAPPSKREIHLGIANQLVLSALIAEAGGFTEALSLHPIAELSYWQLRGGRKGGEITSITPPKEKTLEGLLAEAAEKLPPLLAKYDNPLTPYLAIPDWRNQPRYNDYAHLARISEWAHQ
jgi:ATP-dependent helicase/nuclease subunit B